MALPPEGAAAAETAGSGVNRAQDRSTALGVLAFLALFIVPVALTPATRGTLLTIPPFPTAWWTDYLVLLFGMLAVVYRFAIRTRPLRRSTLVWYVAPFLILGVWQVFSTLWDGQPSEYVAYSVMQSVCMCAAIVGAVFVCSGLSLESRVRVLIGLTLLIAIILFVYFGLSFLFPSLRPSYEEIDRTAAGLGFIRVFGPLGKSTVLNIIIVPALGFSVGMSFLRTHAKSYWLLLAVYFIGCAVSTGSRGGLLCLASYGALVLILGGPRALLVLIPFGLVLLIVVAAVGIPERFKNFQDNARMETYKTALTAYTASPRSALIGVGHGAIYTKLHDDSARKDLGRSRWYLLFQSTKYGRSLRNSHSAILRSLVETGPLGLLLFVAPLVWLAFRPASPNFRSVTRPGKMFLRSSLAGCLAVLPYFCFEEFFVTAFWIVVIWSIYVVCVAEGVDEVAAAP